MSMEIVDGAWGEVFFFDDLLGSENDNNSESVMWNEREVVITPVKKAPHAQYLLAMMRAPDEGTVSGGYSQERGAYGEFKLKWKNQPSPNPSPNKEKEYPSPNPSPNKEKERPSSNSSPNKGKDLSSSNSSPNKGKDPSPKDNKTSKKENPSKENKNGNSNQKPH